MSTLGRVGQAAAERGLPYLVVGGYAVMAHGFSRTTLDLDLLISRGSRQAWTELLAALGYQLWQESSAFLQFTAPPSELPVDLMVVSDDSFAKLAADAQDAHYEDSVSKVVSLWHLLALKCHAIKHGHPGRVEKDVDDVLRLIEVNRLDVNSDKLRETVLTHGIPELYDKLQRTFGKS